MPDIGSVLMAFIRKGLTFFLKIPPTVTQVMCVWRSLPKHTWYSRIFRFDIFHFIIGSQENNVHENGWGGGVESLVHQHLWNHCNTVKYIDIFSRSIIDPIDGKEHSLVKWIPIYSHARKRIVKLIKTIWHKSSIGE